MALISPGVEVTVIDESQYIPAATNSVPYILIATAQNKVSGTGVGVAAGTLAANANRIYLIDSQRDLANTFGVPFFLCEIEYRMDPPIQTTINNSDKTTCVFLSIHWFK